MELSAGVTAAAERQCPDPPRRPPCRRSGRILVRAAGLCAACLIMMGAAGRAAALTAIYHAYWAGLPAGEIRLSLRDGAGSYDDRIEIRAEGLPRLITHFRGTARAQGKLAPGQPADPLRYDALYDLRKRRDSRISMRFVGHDGALIAERGPGDTSHKPPLAERFRRGAVDPVTAVERLRQAIANGSADRRFTIPVYDGARRFDVVARVVSQQNAGRGSIHLELSLRPIAGFKGESSDDGDPDDAPRPVAVTLSDDASLLPLSVSVRVFFLPLLVRLDHVCSGPAACRS